MAERRRLRPGVPTGSGLLARSPMGRRRFRRLAPADAHGAGMLTGAPARLAAFAVTREVELSMTIAEAFAAEFRRESATTRTFLERFPDEHSDWKPHDKSMSLQKLASHLVDVPNWEATILDTDDFDFATSDYQLPDWRTRTDLLEGHQASSARFLAVLAGRSDARMRQIWRLLMGGKVLAEHPRDSAVRQFILSHAVHHRAQLGVYFRLLDVPVPGAYGPSADDPTG